MPYSYNRKNLLFPSYKIVFYLLFCWFAIPVYAQDAIPRFAYVVNSFDDSLSTFIVEADTGRFIPNGHVATGHFPSAVGVHPSGRFVYVTAQSQSVISVYAVNKASGRLTEIKGSPFNAQLTGPFAIAFDPEGKFIYMPARHAQAIMAFAIDQASGALKPVPDAPFASGQRPRQIAMHPNGKFLYAINVFSNNVTGYKINPNTGSLSPVPGSPFKPGDAPIVALYTIYDIPEDMAGAVYNITIDPSGRFAYVANWMSSSVSAFAIDQDSGSLTLVKGSPFITKPHPYAVTVEPQGRYLYAANWFIEEINGYEIDQTTGALLDTPDLSFSAYGNSPVMMLANKSLPYFYVSNYDSNNISAFALDSASGRLKLKETIQTRVGPRGFAILYGNKAVKQKTSYALAVNPKAGSLITYGVNPDSGDLIKLNTVEAGKMPEKTLIDNVHANIYVSNKDDNRLSGFKLNIDNGDLKLLQGSPYNVIVPPTAMSVDDNGRFIYLGDAVNSGTSIYMISEQDGSLAQVLKRSIPVGKNPQDLIVEPVGRYVYVLNSDDDTITTLRAEMGTWPIVQEIDTLGSPFIATGHPTHIATDSQGRFAYVTNEQANNLTAYSINYQTGALVQLEGSPYKTGKHPNAVAVHPSGQHVYVLNQRSGSVTRYQIEKASGTLSQRKQHSVGVNPGKLLIDAQGRYAYISFAITGIVKKYAIDSQSGALNYINSSNLGAGTILTGLFNQFE